MAPRIINPTDKYVASRVRLRRLQLGLSQEELAKALNITFQQVQKYEKGMNRISAGRLLEIATTLSVPLQFFYAGWSAIIEPDADEEALRLSQWMASPEILSLVQAVSSLESPNIRRRISALAAAIAEEVALGRTPPESLTRQSSQDK